MRASEIKYNSKQKLVIKISTKIVICNLKMSNSDRVEVESFLFAHFWFSFQFCRASGWRGANTPGGGLARDLLPQVRVPVSPGELPIAVRNVYSDRMYLN